MRSYYRSLIKNATIITDGLKLYLDAGNVSSYPATGSTWYDISGNSNNATLVNGPTYESANNGSIMLDGTDDWITVSSNGYGVFNTQDFTIDLWVKFNSFLPYSPLWSYDYINHSSQPYYAQHLRLSNDNAVYMAWNIAGSFVQQVISYTFALESWYNIVWTRKSNGDIYAYINSSQVLGISSPGTISYYNQPVWLGRSNFTGFGYSPTPTSGNYANAKFYDRALTPAEVSFNYNVLKSRYGL